MVMEGLEALVERARDTLAAALSLSRSRSASNKSEDTLPRGTKSAPLTTSSHHRGRSSGFHSSVRHPSPHEEVASMRGRYEGVPMREYLAPSPHTVGVPVPDHHHHPSTPHRPPVHPRPIGQERIGIPHYPLHQQERTLHRNPGNNNGSNSNPYLSRIASSRSRLHQSDGHITPHGSGDPLPQQDYGNQFSSRGTLRPSAATLPRSLESIQSERSFQNDQSRRSRSDRRRWDDKVPETFGGRRSRHSSEERSTRRRSASPPPRRRSRSRESNRSRRPSGVRGHSSSRELASASIPPSMVIGVAPNPGVYTISGRDYHESPQLQHIRHLQPVQPEAPSGHSASRSLKWRDAILQAYYERDYKPILPLLPTIEEVIDCIGQQQVIALVCGIITAFLMVLALSSSDWLLSSGWRQGLFAHCISDTAPKPLPFQINAEPGCHTARDEPYIMASAALCIICLLLDVLATLMTGLGLSSNDPAVKTRYYRIAVWVMTIALIAILIALILYPVFFAQELELGNRSLWEFGWAYGVGWGAAIFLFGAVVLLLCDQEEEEIYYKERTIIHAENDSRA